MEPRSKKGPLHKGFSTKMTTPEPNGINPFFQEAPCFTFKMQSDSRWMALCAKRLINDMRAGTMQQSARQNRGIAKFIREIAIKDPDTNEDMGYRYNIAVTPASGYFKVLLIPHRQLAEDLGDRAKPIQLVFDFTNLYLMGFLYRNVWYLYQDARVNELNITTQNKHFIVMMGFDGGYFDFSTVKIKIGFEGLYRSYDTLLNAVQRTQQEVRDALFRIFVSTFEAVRFPYWMTRLLRIYMKKLHVTVDEPEDEPNAKYSEYFNNWSNISEIIDAGEESFQSRVNPVPGISKFEKALWILSVVLGTAMTIKGN